MFIKLTLKGYLSNLPLMKQATPATLYHEIGRAISVLRTRRTPKMSQLALAQAVGLSRASIANIERGLHRVQIHILYDIATVLDVAPHDLLPYPNRSRAEHRLPADMAKELNPKERLAVGRLLGDRNEGGAREKS